MAGKRYVDRFQQEEGEDVTQYLVVDQEPEAGGPPAVYGPKVGSWTKGEAEEFANAIYPEEGDGSAIVVALTEVG